MYRQPDETPHCSFCGSEQLTPPTKFDPSEGYARVHFAIKNAGTGLFEDRFVRMTVDRARVCLACGHVMHFISAEQTRQLAARMAQLEPTTA